MFPRHPKDLDLPGLCAVSQLITVRCRPSSVVGCNLDISAAIIPKYGINVHWWFRDNTIVIFIDYETIPSLSEPTVK